MLFEKYMSEYALVLNSGSSSVKFAVIDVKTGTLQLNGLAECLGSADANISWKIHSTNILLDASEPNTELQGNESAKTKSNSQKLIQQNDHLAAIECLVDIIKVNKLVNSIVVIGHRVVHGGEKFTASVVIDHNVIAEIKNNNKLAPLHNPANLQGIEAAQKLFPTLPQVAVFDTAFHQTMPNKAFIYAIPYSLYQLEGVRRYGFHGTSHGYVAKQAAQLLNKPYQQVNLITAHLGNGCSICAIKNGESVDTSMGFTPLAGISMGTRCGDIDPGIFSYLVNELEYSVQQIDNLLNKQSGLLGISQLSNDCRTLEQAKNNGDKQAELALNIFCYHIAKTIASYAVPLGSIDAIVFTGGIGENSAFIRQQVIELLSFFSLELSVTENLAKRFGEAGCITQNTGIKALVIPTNEELVIAQDAVRLLNANTETN